MALVEGTGIEAEIEQPEDSPLLLAGAIVFASFLAVGFSNVPTVLVAAIVIVWLGGGFAVRWDPMHPYTIFGSGMMLYAIAAPLLAEFDLFQRPLYRAADALQLLYLSFVVVYVVVWPSRLSTTRIRALDPTMFQGGARVVVAIFLPICLLSVVTPFASGFASKEAIAAGGSVLARLTYFSALNVGVSFLLLKAIHSQRSSDVVYTALPFAIFYMIVIGLVGHRYGIYYLLITTLILFSAFRHIRLWHLASLGVVALGLNTLLGGLKLFISATLAGEDILQSTLDFYGTDEFNYWLAYEDVVSRTLKTALLALLGSEPTTVADNLNTLLDFVPYTYAHTYGTAALGDLGRAVSLGFLLDTATGIGADIQNSTVLFNSWVQLEGLLQGSGIGFCMICTGYLDFGASGVVLVSLLLGLALRQSYRWATFSVIGLIFYANLIPIAMTSLRQDLSQIISTPLKQLLLPLLIVWLVALIGRRQQT